MNIYFIGICTHIFPLADGEYRVLLVGADGYVVDGQSIPNHVPALLVREADIADAGQVPAFEGTDLMPVVPPAPGMRAWAPAAAVFTVPSLSGGVKLQDVQQCLPHLAVDTNIQLLQSIARGESPSQPVCASIVLDGGSLQVVRDLSQARHTLLTGPSDANWDLVVQTGGGAPRHLTLHGNAEVHFTNLGAQENGCGKYDYLIHYRVTTRPFVPPADFHAPESCNSIGGFFDLEAIGYVNSSTLSNCSNAVYP